MSVSAARLLANRVNAQRSTGPRTAAGKATASANALRHGLRSERVVLPGEDPRAFDAWRLALIEELQPARVLEWLAVDRIVTLAWRLRRAPAIEASVMRRQVWVESCTRLTYPPVDGLEDPEADPAALEAAMHARDDADDDLGGAVEAMARQSDGLSTLSRYETRLERSLYRTLAWLNDLQARRQARHAIHAVVTAPGGAATPPGHGSGSPEGTGGGPAVIATPA
jgi:hypothetical protein